MLEREVQRILRTAWISFVDIFSRVLATLLFHPVKPAKKNNSTSLIITPLLTIVCLPLPRNSVFSFDKNNYKTTLKKNVL